MKKLKSNFLLIAQKTVWFRTDYWLSQTCEAQPCDVVMKKTSWQAHAWVEMSTHPSHLHYNKEDIFYNPLCQRLIVLGLLWLMNVPVSCAMNH